MAYVLRDRRSTSLSDLYLQLMAVVLLGYALIGKGFAYLGVPPIFVGEIALLAGFVVFLRTGAMMAVLATLPSLVLVALMGWVLLCTLPFIATYGFDSLRDSVVVMYGGFALVIIAVLLEDRRRIDVALRCYGKFLNIYIPIIPFTFGLTRYFEDYIPVWPGYNVPIVEVRAGEVTAHLAGAAIFALAGFWNLSRLSIICLSGTVIVASVSSRGAMLAFVLPVTFACLALGKARQLSVALALGILLFAAAFVVETSVSQYHEARSTSERSLSTRQIVDNVASIFGQAGEQTESTKTWRLDWWNIIIKDTLFGPHFWTGRGFGLNLADADGFRDGDHPNLPSLRSPHNVFMTMLARAGIPGATLWVLLMVSWLSLLAQAAFSARIRGQTRWAGLFLFIGCYGMAIIINALFDVALEGPMSGVWFWCLFGFGIGAVMIHRCEPRACVPRSMSAALPETG